MATFGSKKDQIRPKWRFSAQTWPFDQVLLLKSHFWPRNSIQRQKLSKTSILNAIRRFDFRTFWEICKMAPKSGQKSPKMTDICSRKKVLKSADFEAILQISQNVRKSKRLIAFSILVLLRKMWIRRLSTREHPKVPKNAFFGEAWKWSKITGYTLWGPFWRFCRCSSSAVCCPFELKIILGAL